MGLPKAYHYIPHNSLIPKLEECRLDKIALSFLLDYLSRNRKRTKIGPVYSEWVEILSGIPKVQFYCVILSTIYIIF